MENPHQKAGCTKLGVGRKRGTAFGKEMSFNNYVDATRRGNLLVFHESPGAIIKHKPAGGVWMPKKPTAALSLRSGFAFAALLRSTKVDERRVP
jgi:AICAR transformylase/IMP cyclohydrolase PurH